MPTSEKNRDLLIWCAIWLFILSLVVMGVGVNSVRNARVTHRIERVQVRTEQAAREARAAASRADHTLTSVVDEFTKAAADPARVAETKAAQERNLAMCRAILGDECPTVPATTTTSIGPPAPDGG